MHFFVILCILYVSNKPSLAFTGFENSDDYSTLVEEEENFKYCVCVPFWQCKEHLDGLDENGINFFDMRGIYLRNKNTATCSGDLDVCCKVECGKRGFVSSSTTGKKNVNTRILGGEETEFAEFPWMLGILKGKAYKCGGSLIHPKITLTAAHCVASPATYSVRAGEWNWEENKEPLSHQDRKVEQIIVHSNYDPGSLGNDIALLVLNEPFMLTKHVNIICLPPPTLKIDIDQCVASGWGRNSLRKGSYQPILKKVNLPIVPRDRCLAVLKKATLGSLFSLHASFICAGGENKKDTCKGDGGSPLMCPIEKGAEKYQQVGIVSWGLTCGMHDSPGVYVNVIMFSDWIDSQMIKLGLDTDIYRY